MKPLFGIVFLLSIQFISVLSSEVSSPSFVERLSCTFDSFSQAREGPQVESCSGGSGLNKWTWYRAFRFFPYQFDIVPNLAGAESGTKFAVSRCSPKPSRILDCPNVPTAVIRSPTYNPDRCTTFGLTFWYRVSHTPVVSDDRSKDYYLELVLHYSGNPWPQRRLWYSPEDTTPGQWIYVEQEFEVEKFRQFTLNFFAHHNDYCQDNIQDISLDAIQTAVLKEEDCAGFTPSESLPVNNEDIRKFCSAPFALEELYEALVTPVEPFLPTGQESEEVNPPTVVVDEVQPVPEEACPYPHCYEWRIQSNLHHLSCYFGNRAQTSIGPDVDACAGWHRTTSWFDYQFDIVSYEEEGVKGPFSGGAMFALSKCTKKQNSYSSENTAVAVLQSPVYPGKNCQHYQVTFWYVLSDGPNFSRPREFYFLQLRLQYVAEKGIPKDVVWGAEEDYESFIDAGVWRKVTVEFVTDQDGGFLLNFMAHHNDNCQRDIRPIGVDSIETKLAVRGIC